LLAPNFIGSKDFEFEGLSCSTPIDKRGDCGDLGGLRDNLKGMNFLFEVTAGAQKGARFKIEDGLIIGRGKSPGADKIALDDPKVSSEHARIEKRDETWYLLDLKSSNGLKINGKKTSELELQEGLTVQIGRTFLKVLKEAASGSAKSWPQDLLHLLERLENHLQQNGDFQDAQPFTPPLELTFVSGPQMGERWILGYGPRQIGSSSPEFKLILPASADAGRELDFEIRPSAAGPLFRTANSDLIRLNGESKTADTLKDGDTIEISGTKIEVRAWRE
jgi:pSer/pThr/pTyr-binding forkhead associated (FHA) protein